MAAPRWTSSVYRIYYGRALLIFAVFCTGHARATTCPGRLNVPGYGDISLVNAGSNAPGVFTEVANDHLVIPHMNSRIYFGDECSQGEYRSEQYVALRLLGKKLKYTVDVSGAGCGCNAAFYLTSMHQNLNISECGDYYCDANKVCGVACAEIDIMEANEHSWHSTLHGAHDRGGVAGGYGGGVDWNGPRDWTSEQYGIRGKCIDTSKPFHVEASFHAHFGSLTAFNVVLLQDGQSCTLALTLNSYTDMAEMSKALAEGMTPIISYWRSNDMLWMDGKGADGKGFCERDNATACGDAVKLSNVVIEDLPGELSVQGASAPSTTAEAGATSSKDSSRGDSFESSSALTTQTEEHKFGRYTFVGFANARNARKACGDKKRLAMPRTGAEQVALKTAVDVAMHSGVMAKVWPNNTLWLAGQWNQKHLKWEWDDGSALLDANWAPGQPSSALNQKEEPWLCMVQDGHVHDSEGGFQFGIMCEDGNRADGPPADEFVAEHLFDTTAEIIEDTAWSRRIPKKTSPHVAVVPSISTASPSSLPPWVNQVVHTTPSAPAAAGLGQAASASAIQATPAEIPSALHPSWNGITPSQSETPVMPSQPLIPIKTIEVKQVGGYSAGVAVPTPQLAVQASPTPAPTQQVLATTPKPTPAPTGVKTSKYEFMGFSGPTEARRSCGPGRRLAMPRTPEDQVELAATIEAAIAAGQMSRTWPDNTVWIAGQWSSANLQWEWDDGSVMSSNNWADNQPGPYDTVQLEPWLCMESGQLYNSDFSHSFGIMCESGASSWTPRASSAEQNSVNVGFCCQVSADSRDKCESCLMTARAGPNAWCGQSQEHCSSCGGPFTWCESASEDAAASQSMVPVIMTKASLRHKSIDAPASQSVVHQVSRIPVVAGVAAALLALVGTFRSRKVRQWFDDGGGMPSRYSLITNALSEAQASKQLQK